MSKKIIGMFIGPYPFGGFWDETNLEKGGIGGSEIWAIELAETFEKRGYHVIMLGGCSNWHFSDGGVEYIPWQHYMSIYKYVKFDYFIASRRTDCLNDVLQCDKTYLMTHDTVVILSPYGERIMGEKYLKGISYQSDYQRVRLNENYPLNDSLFFRTYQGIHTELYKDVDYSQKKNRALWSSGKGRGAEYVVKNVFPLIKKAVPDFELYICGYNDTYTEDIYKQDGIKCLGNLDKKDLIQQQKECKIWLYPNHGWGSDLVGRCEETFCITAIENGVAKNALIIGDWGAFSSTMEGYEGFISKDLFTSKIDPMPKENADKFAEDMAKQAIKCLTDEAYCQKLANSAYEISKKYTWDFVADAWEKEFKKEG